MTQEELEHLLHARAGPRGPLNVFQFTEEMKEVEVPDPDNPSAGAKKKVLVPIRTWTDPGTGQVVRVQVSQDGQTYTKLFDGIDPKAVGDPAVNPAEARAQAAADAPDVKTQTVTRNNQVYTVTTTTPKGGTAATVITDGTGTVVPTLPAETKPSELGAPVEGPGGRLIRPKQTTDAQGNTSTDWVDAATGAPSGPPPKAGESKYVRVEQDKDSGQWQGLTKDGRWEPMQGGPGAQAPTPAGARTPRLPDAVLEATQAGLRQYHESLWAEVDAGRRTPAWAQARWAEAYQTAGVALDTARVLQREQESSLGAEVTLSGNRLSALSSGFNTILRTASEMNANLPPGSDLGGKGFLAMLKLQSEYLKQSGAWDVQVPPRSGLSISDQMRGAPAPGGGGFPPGPNAIPPLASSVGTGGGIGAVTAPGGPAVAPPVVPGSGGAPPPVRDDWRTNPGAPAGMPTAGSPAGPPLAPGPVWEPPPNPAAPSAIDIDHPAPAVPGVTDIERPAPQPSGPDDMRLDRGGVGMTPGMPDFAALGAMSGPYHSGITQQPQPQPAAALSSFQSPAMQRSMIASTPPWRMTEDQYQWAQANGFEDDFWRTRS